MKHLSYRVLCEEEKHRLEGKRVRIDAVRLKFKYLAKIKGVLTKKLVKTCHGQILPKNFSRECKFCSRK